MPVNDVHCYATRLLNPFHGTAQIVSTEQARAISADGVNWRIQIRSGIYKTPWSSLAIPEHYDRYFVYGVWSQQDGLARVPIHPSLYADHVQEAAEDLLVRLNPACRQLPFVLEDSIELWLMDTTSGQAVALLASLRPDDDIPMQRQVHWYAAQNTDTPFHTMAFAEEQARSTIKLQPQDLLQRIINQRCRPPLEAYWVERQPDGSGNVLHNHAGKPVRLHETLAAASFPVDLLDDRWHDPHAAQLVRDYLNWLAPLLLMLPLPESRRRELELAAQKRPLAVHRYHHLYPSVIDEALLKKILVEAVMRKASNNS